MPGTCGLRVGPCGLERGARWEYAHGTWAAVQTQRFSSCGEHHKATAPYRTQSSFKASTRGGWSEYRAKVMKEDKPTENPATRSPRWLGAGLLRGVRGK